MCKYRCTIKLVDPALSFDVWVKLCCLVLRNPCVKANFLRRENKTYVEGFSVMKKLKYSLVFSNMCEPPTCTDKQIYFPLDPFNLPHLQCNLPHHHAKPPQSQIIFPHTLIVHMTISTSHTTVPTSHMTNLPFYHNRKIFKPPT